MSAPVRTSALAFVGSQKHRDDGRGKRDRELGRGWSLDKGPVPHFVFGELKTNTISESHRESQKT